MRTYVPCQGQDPEVGICQHRLTRIVDLLPSLQQVLSCTRSSRMSSSWSSKENESVRSVNELRINGGIIDYLRGIRHRTFLVDFVMLFSSRSSTLQLHHPVLIFGPSGRYSVTPREKVCLILFVKHHAASSHPHNDNCRRRTWSHQC